MNFQRASQQAESYRKQPNMLPPPPRRKENQHLMPTRLHSNMLDISNPDLLQRLFVLRISSVNLNWLLTAVSGLEIGVKRKKKGQKR